MRLVIILSNESTPSKILFSSSISSISHLLNLNNYKNQFLIATEKSLSLILPSNSVEQQLQLSDRDVQADRVNSSSSWQWPHDDADDEVNSGSALFSGDAVMSRCVDQHTSLLVIIQWGVPLSSPWFVCLCASFPVFVPPPPCPGRRIASLVHGWVVVIVPTEPPEHANQPTTHQWSLGTRWSSLGKGKLLFLPL